MSSSNIKTPFIRRSWFAFISSMRFAVALLCVLALASIIGTVLQQNQSAQSYVVKFGPFWAQIFDFLGLYDMYTAWWFVLILLFLVISTSLCLWRNIPSFLREMRSFRLKTTAKSLAHMKYTSQINTALSPEIAVQYFHVHGFQTKIAEREDGSTLLAAKKGSANKWGYIFAHAAIIIICLGGLIDSNLLLKIKMLFGNIVADNTSVYARDFQKHSILNENNLSFRANAEVIEGQTIESAFLNTHQGLLLQKLPFTLQLKKFHIDFYDTGMPKNFASDVILTDKASGKQTNATIRVNHPLIYQGIAIYQANYGDGGSNLKFNIWNLNGTGASAQMHAISQRQFPLDLGKKGQFRLEFSQLRPFNVENMDNNMGKTYDVRSVNQVKHFRNTGPSITFKLRDNAGQAHEYINYMLPLQRDGAWFFATGERSSMEQPYRWLMIPADPSGKLDSFMALREVLLSPETRATIVEKAIANVDNAVRPQFKLAVENLLKQFSSGGYIAINDYIQKTVADAEQAKTGELMYQILYSTVNLALDEALKQKNLPTIANGETRNSFILNSLDAYTSLTLFQSPVLLQLSGYKQVNMSGLQMTKSPGTGLVYLGSLLLVLGTIFMFYIREKRAWVLFEQGKIRFAMSSARNERELEHIFPQYTADLNQLAHDLSLQHEFQ